MSRAESPELSVNLLFPLFPPNDILRTVDRFCLYLAAPFLLLLSPLQSQEPAFYQKRAEVALQFEMGQIGKDCSNVKNTLEANSCLGPVAEKTRNNFRSFYESLRSLLQSSPESVERLDSSQALFEKYSTSACDGIGAFYRSGAIRISAVVSCHIQLIRSRMRDLDSIYNTTLHH